MGRVTTGKKRARKSAPVRKHKRAISARERGRERPMISITLSPEAIGAGSELSKMRGMTRSSLIEYLIREESLRMRIDLHRWSRKT